MALCIEQKGILGLGEMVEHVTWRAVVIELKGSGLWTELTGPLKGGCAFLARPAVLAGKMMDGAPKDAAVIDQKR